jgi:two-component system KDP operon response regulator KdpE
MTSRGRLVLVVEPEPETRRFMRPAMLDEGLRVVEVDTADEALHIARRHSPDLILLSLGSGEAIVEFTKRVRTWSRVPIIVISSRGSDADKIVALDAGADDYVTKPIAMLELLARMRVAFRHAEALPREEGDILSLGPLSIDRARREVRVVGREVHLTPIEYKLLVVLAENAGRVLTRRRLVERVWGPGYPETTHNVVVRIAHLRSKLEADPRRPQLLITVPGVGYRLRELPPEVSAR